jgi:hypothetical protein
VHSGGSLQLVGVVRRWCIYPNDLEAINRPTDANIDRAWAAKLRGEQFQVWWEGKWYDSEIIKYYDKQYNIHYTGYSDEWDEWVSDSRIRFTK